MRIITLTAGATTCEGELLDTDCAQAIWNALPLSAEANTWGDEIYFTIPVHHGLDTTAREVVEKGDLGYWPQGPAFCIFFGPTPISKGKEIRAASAVNVVGRLFGDPAVLRKVLGGSLITLDKKEDA
jgi:uncharacterized protein